LGSPHKKNSGLLRKENVRNGIKLTGGYTKKKAVSKKGFAKLNRSLQNGEENQPLRNSYADPSL
jgi:hypothetical protein